MAVVTVISRKWQTLDLLGPVKRLLFLDVGDHDTLLTNLIPVAIETVERYTGLAIGEQTRRAVYDRLVGSVELPYSPLLTGLPVSISLDGTLTSGVLTATWPTGGSIVYSCGLRGDALPAGLKMAVAACVAELSGLSDNTPGNWKALARPYRQLTWAG